MNRSVVGLWFTWYTLRMSALDQRHKDRTATIHRLLQLGTTGHHVVQFWLLGRTPHPCPHKHTLWGDCDYASHSSGIPSILSSIPRDTRKFQESSASCFGSGRGKWRKEELDGGDSF